MTHIDIELLNHSAVVNAVEHGVEGQVGDGIRVACVCVMFLPNLFQEGSYIAGKVVLAV
jgi:hypothetical protein